MEIDQVFHLTPLVNDLALATERFESVFGPHIWYRGYERHVNNRDAALMVVGDFVIEPLCPKLPWDDKPVTSHRRYLDRFGECIHSVAVYATGLDEIERRCTARGIRTTDGGMPTTIFPHPKDFPGLIEFFDISLEPSAFDINPRRHPEFSAAYWREMHPLRMQRASHVTLVVRDHLGAAKLYNELFDCTILPDQPSRSIGCESSYVTFGTDTMIELAQPVTDDSPLTEALERIGESWWGATFTVSDLDVAADFLAAEHIAAPTTRAGNTLRIDPAWFFGAEYAFSDEPLLGDPRV